MVLRRDMPTADTTIDLAVLRDALRAARGRIALVALAAAVLVGGGAAWRADPMVMETRILIEPIAASGEAGSGTPETGRAARDDRLIAAQIELLGSTGLLRRVVAAAAADPSRPLASLGDAARDGAGLEREDHRLAALRAALSIERVDRSRLIGLRLATTDRGAGEHLLATLWRDYDAGLAEARGRAEAEADRRRGAEVIEARRRLADAEAPRPTPVAAALPAEDPEGNALRAERDDVALRLKRLEDFAGSGEAGASRAVDAGLTDGLRQLREKRGLLRSRIAELSIVYLENHPLLKEATDRLADLRGEIRAELPRAVAAQKAALAALDRRLADHVATTASIPEAAPAAPVVDLAGLRAAFAQAQGRRDAAYVEALGLAAVQASLIGGPEVVETPSRARPILAAGLAGLIGAGLAALLAVLLAAPSARGREEAAPPVADPVEADEIVAEPLPPAAPSRPIDAEAPHRAALYAAATDRRITDLWDQIESEIPRGRRIVVTSVGDAARAHAAARLLWANAAVAQASACLVDLAGTVPEDDAATPGFTDILSGEAAFSEAIHHDHDCGGWVVPAGREPPAPETFGDESVAGILDALAATWADVVLDVGRLVPGEGLATLLIGADVIVLAEDDRDDPRVLRALDALLSAGKAVWLLDPPHDEVVPTGNEESLAAADDAWDVAA